MKELNEDGTIKEYGINEACEVLTDKEIRRAIWILKGSPSIDVEFYEVVELKELPSPKDEKKRS